MTSIYELVQFRNIHFKHIEMEEKRNEQICITIAAAVAAAAVRAYCYAIKNVHVVCTTSI